MKQNKSVQIMQKNIVKKMIKMILILNPLGSSVYVKHRKFVDCCVITSLRILEKKEAAPFNKYKTKILHSIDTLIELISLTLNRWVNDAKYE